MSWKNRLLCWLGFHRWVYSAGLIGDDLISFLDNEEKCCLRCGKLGSKRKSLEK